MFCDGLFGILSKLFTRKLLPIAVKRNIFSLLSKNKLHLRIQMYTIQDMISLHGHRTTLFIVFLSTEKPTHTTDKPSNRLFLMLLVGVPHKKFTNTNKNYTRCGSKKVKFYDKSVRLCNLQWN